MQFDNILNEISKISIMKSITALSRFLQRPIGIDFKPIEICPFDILQLMSTPEDTLISTFIPIKGNLHGAFALLYSEKSGLSMCDLLLNRANGQTKVFDVVEKSALTEVANICIGNFLTVFAEILQLRILKHEVALFDQASFLRIGKQISSIFINNSKELVMKISSNFRLNHIQANFIVLFEHREIIEALEKVSYYNNNHSIIKVSRQ